MNTTSAFEFASRDKLRFQTPKGNLPSEDLWGFTLPALKTMASATHKEIKAAEETDLFAESKVDPKTLAKFDILMHIISVKTHEATRRAESAKNREHNELIRGIIAGKQVDALRGKSIDELSALIK